MRPFPMPVPKAEVVNRLSWGLDAADLDHILTAFPVFARKHPEFFVYLLQRLEEWKTE